VVFMTHTTWISSRRRFHVTCGIGFQAKRGLHVVCGLGFRQSAVFMTHMTWISSRRGLHATCDLGFKQDAITMLFIIWFPDKARSP
jgi:hypothetical protein